MNESSSIDKIRPTKDASVFEIQNYLRAIYGSKNSLMLDDYLFSFIAEKSGILTRAVTKAHRLGEKYQPEPELIIRPLSWLIALANNHKIDLGTAFINKFPGVCPHCLEAICICNATDQKPLHFSHTYEIQSELKSRAGAYINSPNKRITFDKVAEMLSSIYPNNAADWKTRPEILFSKILEELGELREALRKYELKQVKFTSVEEEVVDIFAWLCATWKLIYHPRPPSLNAAIIGYYAQGCPICGLFPCDCNKGSDRYYTLIMPAEFSKLKELLLQLRESTADVSAKSIIDNLLKSLDTAIEEPKGVLVKHFFRELITAMKATSADTASSPNTRSLASDLLNAVTSLPSQKMVISKKI